MKKLTKLLSLLLFVQGAWGSLFYDLNTGVELFYKNKFQESLTYFINYTNSNPSDKDGYFWLAKSYNALNDSKNAKINFKKAYNLASIQKNIEKINISTQDDSTIDDYFDMAVSYFESGNYKEADFYADMMLRLDSKSKSAYYLKARVQKALNNNEKAIEYLNKAVLFDNTFLYTNLAKSLKVTKVPKTTKETYDILALEATYGGNINNAINNYKKFLEFEPKNIEVLNSLADLYIKKQDFNNAQLMVDEALKIEPNNIWTYLNEAKIYEHNNKEKVEQTLLRAHKINPNNKEIILRLGNYYLEQEKFDESKKYFENLITIDDTCYEGYFGYIYSLIELGQINKAQNQVRKMNHLKQKNGEIDYLLAKICISQGQFISAKDYLEEAIKKEKNENYYLELAKINYLLGDYKESLNNLEFVSKKTEAKEYWIRNYIKLKDAKSASQVSFDKNRLIYKYFQYEIYNLNNQTDKAKTIQKELKSKKPTSKQDFIDLAQINLEQKNIQNAIKTLDSMLKKYPNDKRAYIEKIKIYFVDENQQKLKETIQKLQEIN